METLNSTYSKIKYEFRYKSNQEKKIRKNLMLEKLKIGMIFYSRGATQMNVIFYQIIDIQKNIITLKQIEYKTKEAIKSEAWQYIVTPAKDAFKNDFTTKITVKDAVLEIGFNEYLDFYNNEKLRYTERV